METTEQAKIVGPFSGGLKNTTPEWMSKIANGIIFACLVWALFSGSITELSDVLKADITRWLMIISGVIKLATKFFGLKLPTVEDKQ